MRCTDRQCQSEIAMSSKLGERAAIPRNQEYSKLAWRSRGRRRPDPLVAYWDSMIAPMRRAPPRRQPITVLRTTVLLEPLEGAV